MHSTTPPPSKTRKILIHAKGRVRQSRAHSLPKILSECRDRCYHAMANDISACLQEILNLKIKDIIFKSTDEGIKYAKILSGASRQSQELFQSLIRWHIWGNDYSNTQLVALLTWGCLARLQTKKSLRSSTVIAFLQSFNPCIRQFTFLDYCKTRLWQNQARLSSATCWQWPEPLCIPSFSTYCILSDTDWKHCATMRTELRKARCQQKSNEENGLYSRLYRSISPIFCSGCEGFT